MEISVSLPSEDVALLDEYARTRGLASRSAALQAAVSMLRFPDLERDYEVAWTEWEASEDRAAWDATAGDGVDATR